MSILNKVSNFVLGRVESPQHIEPMNTVELAGKSANGMRIGSEDKAKLPWTDRPTSQSVKDIYHWKEARLMTQADTPQNYGLQIILDEVSEDAHLTSQVENRTQQLLNIEYSFKNKSGEIDEDTTKKIRKSGVYKQITEAITSALYFGYTLGEFRFVKTKKGLVLNFDLIPRTNVVPKDGVFYFDYAEDKKINYRDLPDYGRYILEFYPKKNDLGILNKAVPHVLIKKFAHSNWSEFCEIFGIPPRVLKTNTADTSAMARGKKMMSDTGSASWFIIDSNEEFEWAKGVSTTGNVYENLIQLCNNEISMLISGAVVGQDTKNGSNAKEGKSQELLTAKVMQDAKYVEQVWNEQVIPALEFLGFIPEGLDFEFDPSEDMAELWARIVAMIPLAEVDLEWVADKFGIKIKGPKAPAAPSKDNLNFEDFFG